MTNAEKIAEWREQHPENILNEDILLKILGVDSLAGIDLSNAWLPLINLENANLEGTNLSHANLQEANLKHASLQGANLQGARLQKANLQCAYLPEVNLKHAGLQEANLQYANLARANLHGANLREANLQGANLSKTHLQHTWLAGANLLDADLLHARLEHTTLQYTNLIGAETDEILQLTGVHKYQTIVLPTEQGWQINIGCWWGYLDDLKKLIAQDTWVESKGKQVIEQRPYMENLIQFLETYMALKNSENGKA
ncbi:pentapeptide repeat-containing protein [Arcanobacterium urinimassiliense]|uniref:pentapeptide repeat-containing protein n=1 Tax=Arcanobacterium urinimassiliense TaxID=1871014 RepID=UPI00093B1C92|nr:pentapeptide repeat-containing protein [Arcanobacterium urinimassiliense]